MKFLFLFLFLGSTLFGQVHHGIDCIGKSSIAPLLKSKRVGLVTNHSAVTSELEYTYKVLLEGPYSIVALFAPEHGFFGSEYAGEHVKDLHFKNTKVKQLPIHSLHGATRRPTEKMLKDIDLLLFDIQDVGVRPYTYVSTLFYAMEEAAKAKVAVVVLDRPNPLGGNFVDGPMLEDPHRSFIGYLHVPYCHGMTIGELARFFNEEYKVGCDLHIVPMQGWKRWMRYKDLQKLWVPTSPHIPEADSPFYYATTSILGELGLVNTGVGYTLPFKLVGAPWIDAEKFAKAMNSYKLPGVKFLAVHYKPFYALYANKPCHGVQIYITDYMLFRPVTTQCALLGTLKAHYPEKMMERLNQFSGKKQQQFFNVCGSKRAWELLVNEKDPTAKLIALCREESKQFLEKRAKYMMKEYD